MALPNDRKRKASHDQGSDVIDVLRKNGIECLYETVQEYFTHEEIIKYVEESPDLINNQLPKELPSKDPGRYLFLVNLEALPFDLASDEFWGHVQTHAWPGAETSDVLEGVRVGRAKKLEIPMRCATATIKGEPSQPQIKRQICWMFDKDQKVRSPVIYQFVLTARVPGVPGHFPRPQSEGYSTPLPATPSSSVSFLPSMAASPAMIELTPLPPALECPVDIEHIVKNAIFEKIKLHTMDLRKAHECAFAPHALYWERKHYLELGVKIEEKIQEMNKHLDDFGTGMIALVNQHDRNAPLPNRF